MQSVRRDIQLLRGLAVLMVVFYHARVGGVERGFLGVDVFFVVSGFLMTSIILRELHEHRFTFSGFYLRRAKRLLPALYCTLAVTALLAYRFVAGTQWRDFVAQLLGAVSFSANLVLPAQVGYFEGAAEGKPLLHIWSLSLEEQYYFCLPLLLVLTPAGWRLRALIGLTLVSGAWCLAWTADPEAIAPLLWRFADAKRGEWAFYLFPTRAWELLAGSVCAWLALHRPVRVPVGVRYGALAVILAGSCVGLDPVHPRGDALVLVLATALVLLGRDDWLPAVGPVRWLERVGDWSYSVYLVHWPLFAFAFLGFTGDVPLGAKVLLVPLSLLLGWAQYRCVETPFRYGWKRRSRAAWGGLAAASLAVLFIPAPMVLGSAERAGATADSYAQLRRHNDGLSSRCNRWLDESGVDAACIRGEHPALAVWGDSFAMHLVPGLLKGHGELIQLTKSVCGPLLGLAPLPEGYSRDWAERCTAFNAAALRRITGDAAITRVVLGSTFGQYFNGRPGRFLVDGRVIDKQPAPAVDALAATVERLAAAGKRPLLVGPPPRSGFNIGECLERRDTGAVLFRSRCDVRRADYLAYEREVREALRAVQRRTGVPILWLDELLCDDAWCQTQLDGIYLYRDIGHLSVAGSERLLGDLQLR